MVEVLLFVNIGLLVIGSVTLTIAVFVLQKARGYVELAEARMERLREGQEHLFQLLREERRPLSEESPREESLVPEVKGSSRRRDAEPGIEELEKELQKLRDGKGDELLQQKSGSPQSATRSKAVAQNVGALAEEKLDSGKTQVNADMSSTAKSFQKTSPGHYQKTPESRGTGLAVRHAHPDDDVSLRRDNAKQYSPRDGAPVKMFREHYHRYLENYEGYVKLAERLCQMREVGEVPHGSPAEREWEQKLRRLNDGIQRTTARLDILEQYNPELASDDRVSHRADIARSYSELEKRLSNTR